MYISGNVTRILGANLINNFQHCRREWDTSFITFEYAISLTLTVVLSRSTYELLWQKTTGAATHTVISG